MKIMMMTDLEGISLVDSIDMIDESTDGYRFACERLMADVNAAVQGAVDAGADEILVFDGHGSGKNFIPELLDPRAKQFKDMNEPGIYDNCYAYLLIGMHAKSGTMKAFLDHTQSSTSWYNYYINGERQGEIAQEAAFSGSFGIPTVMMSGDEAACREAALLIPGIECAEVKRANERNCAECADAAEAEKRIREAVVRGIGKAAEIKPYTIEYPAELKLEYVRTDICDRVTAANPWLERIDGRTVRKTIDRIGSFHDLVF